MKQCARCQKQMGRRRGLMLSRSVGTTKPSGLVHHTCMTVEERITSTAGRRKRR